MKVSAGSTKTNKRPTTYIPNILPTPEATSKAPIDIVENNDNKTLLHQTIYHVNRLKTDHLTTKHLCHHIHNGLTPEDLTRIHPEEKHTPILDIPFATTWKATWLLEDIIRTFPNGNAAIHNYKMSKLPLKKKI